MPTTATLQAPDIDPAPVSGTTTAVQTHGWFDGVQDTAVAGKRRNMYDTANRTYGCRLLNLVLPHPAPPAVLLRLGTFIDKDAQHKQAVRRLVLTLLASQQDPAKTRTLKARIKLASATLDPGYRPAVADAQHVINEYQAIQEILGKRLRIDKHEGGLGHPAIYGLALNSPLAVILGATVGGLDGFGLLLAYLAGLLGWAYLGLRTGWLHGYDQAFWHAAETSAYHGKDLTRVADLNTKAKAEAQQHRMSRKPKVRLPKQRTGEGCIYVIEFSTGTVKVGQTEDPQRRIGTHFNEAAAFGVAITNYWISPAHANFLGNETRLINQCMKVSRRSRKEYFHNVGYQQARGFARNLTYYSADTDGTSTEGGWA